MLAAATGRDASLTGRVPLWGQVIRQIRLRPILGHGFGGFWDADSVTVQYIWFLIDWRPPDAHNGYLDVLLQIGLVGFVLYAWIWFRVLRVGGRELRAGSHSVARWMMMFMAINVVTNVDEGPLPSPDIFTLLMAGTLLLVSVWDEQYRLRALVRRWQPIASPLDRVRARSVPQAAQADRWPAE